MGAVSILGFGALEGFGWCWVMGFLRVLLGSALWASWALPLYTPCVLRGALRFFLMKFLLTYQKKKLQKQEEYILVLHSYFLTARR